MKTQNEIQNVKVTIKVEKSTIRNRKYFVYHDKKYLIDFDLLVINSNYFYKNQEQYKNIDHIPILNENDDQVDLPEEAIESFISLCQNQTCDINYSSIIALQYLSNKFEYPELARITKTLIDEHSNELVFQSILFKKMIEEKTGQKQDTKEEEEIISANIEQYIKNDQILFLSIPSLERIIHQSYMKNCIKNTKEFIEFLFKSLDKYGEDASILFNDIDFGEEKVYVVNRLLKDYSDKFDFNMINSTLLKTTKELTSEVTKQKEEYERLFNDMRTEIEQQKRELILMKEEEKKRLNDIEKQHQNQLKIMNDELEKIRNQNEKQMLMFKQQFDKLIEENHKTIQTEVVQHDHQFIKETMNIYKINKLNDETRNYFIQEIIKQNENKTQNVKNEKYDQLIQRVLFNHRLFNVLSKTDKENNAESLIKDDIVTKMNFISRNLVYIQVKFDTVENLYHKKYLNTFLADIIQNYDQSSIELIYPSTNFNPINDIIKQFPILFNKIHILVHIYDDENNSSELPRNSANLVLVLKLKYFEMKEYFYSEITKFYMNKLKEGKTEIKKNGFENNSSLSQIIFPSFIKSIGYYSFYKCTTLTHVTIPSSVTDISKNAFAYCKSLKEIALPSSLHSIQENAFENCSSLRQISIPSSVTFIGNEAFAGCSSMTQFSIPSSITTINAALLRSCSSLKQIKIPSSISSIGYSAFSYCSSLTQISIPSSVNSIGCSAFSDCSSLTQITIPSSIKKIESSTFYGCSSLAQIIIPSSVTSLQDNVFAKCTSLIYVSIPRSVNSIGDRIFNECPSLAYIEIPYYQNLKNYTFNSNIIIKKI